MMNYSYTVKTNKDLDSAVKAIEEITAAKSFRVLHIHDVQDTLAGKGFNREPYKIIEICNAGFAHKALGANIDVGLFLPCKINIYTNGGSTYISAMRPTMIADFFENSDLQKLAHEVDTIVRSIVDEAK